MNDNLILQDSSQPNPSRADALKNRALLLETARRLFIQKGVDAVTMSAIADAAGVGKGTLYRHFESKSQICHALLDQEMRDLQESSLRRLQNGGDPFDDLQWFIEQVVHFVICNIHMLSIEEPFRSDNDRKQQVPALDEPYANMPLLGHPAHLWWRQTIRGLLGRINPAGNLDLDYFTDMIYVMLDARTMVFQMRALNYDEARIVNGLKSAINQILH
jgi:AcrR family transcriptional regulator